MPKTYDLYGFARDDLDAIRESVEDALGIRFAPHESSFIGDYYLYEHDGECFTLRPNIDPIDNEPFERDFPTIGSLLFVERTDRAEEIERALQRVKTPITLLRRTFF